jgi:hypothetical protein
MVHQLQHIGGVGGHRGGVEPTSGRPHPYEIRGRPGHKPHPAAHAPVAATLVGTQGNACSRMQVRPLPDS